MLLASLVAVALAGSLAGCGRSGPPSILSAPGSSTVAGGANGTTTSSADRSVTTSVPGGSNPSLASPPGLPATTSPAGGALTTTSLATTTTASAATVSSLVQADPGSGPCGALGRLDTGIAEVATATGDLDGDGQLDAVLSYRGRDGVVRLRAIFGGGRGGFESTQPGVAAGWKVLGMANLSSPTSQGGDVIFATLAGPEAVQQVGLFRLDSCSLVPIVTEAGAPVELRRGGQTSGVEGFRCERRPDVSLDQYQGSSGSDGSWSLTSTGFTLVGNRLVKGVTTAIKMTAPQFAAYLSAACGSVS